MGTLSKLTKKADYKSSLTTLLTMYIKNGDFFTFLEKSLLIIGEYLEVTGVHLFQFDFSRKTLKNTIGWNRTGSTLVREVAHELDFSQCAWVIENVLQNGSVSLPDIETISSIAPSEYDLLKKTNITSLYDVLLTCDNEPWGFLAIEYDSSQTNVELIEKESDTVAFILSSIIQRFTLEQKIVTLNERDPLTHFYNRQTFIDTLKNWRMPYTLFFIDINNFKQINDTYNHEIGDMVIEQTATHLQKIIEKNNTFFTCLGRYGGDEFIIAISSTDLDVIQPLTKKLQQKIFIQNTKYPSILVDFSVGYTHTQNKVIGDAGWIKTAIHQADYAMYAAKKRPNNTCVDFNTVKEQYNIDRTVGQELETAIKKKEIYAVFQPKVSVRSTIISSCEVLCRWNYKGTKELSPALFIPSIETNGKMHVLDFYMLNEACLFLKTLAHRGIRHRCSVNISLKTLGQKDVVQQIYNIIQINDIMPQQITLEILEAVFEYDDATLSQKIDELRAFGFRISIDDFGLAYSSLSRLYNVSFDEIKIPREFVTKLDSTITRKIFELILLFSKNVGTRTVVEGVETEEEFKTCLEKGVDDIQGYYFSKPLKEIDYINYLTEKNTQHTPISKHNIHFSIEMLSTDQILSHIPQAILVLDEENTILYSNNQLEKILQLQPANIVGGNLGSTTNCYHAHTENSYCGNTTACHSCIFQKTLFHTIPTEKHDRNYPQTYKTSKVFHINGKNIVKQFQITLLPYTSAFHNATIVVLNERFD